MVSLQGGGQALAPSQDSHSSAWSSTGTAGIGEMVSPHTAAADRIPTVLGLRGDIGHGANLQIKDIWHQAVPCEMGPA